MSSVSKDPLFRLIKLLTKAEKRHFRLYANRTVSKNERKFLLLFDALDKMEVYDEAALVKRLPSSERSHLPHLKRHLFRQLLSSLRLVHIQRNIDIQIREQLDFARVLYGKGLYMESLRILERTKQTAEEHHQDILHLEVIEFQKFIEARHITRSRQVGRKMDKLLLDATQRSEVTLASSELSNLNIQIQGYYIDHGHTKTPEDEAQLHLAWLEMQPLPKRIESVGTFFEKVNRFQAHLWYNYIRLNLPAARENAAEWVALFRLNPQMCTKDPDLYMRGLYYLLTFNFLLNDATDYKRYLDEFSDFVTDLKDEFMPGSELIAFQYLSLSRLNHLLLTCRFEEAPPVVEDVRAGLQKYGDRLDDHRLMLFYYKFAYFKFALGDYQGALDELDDILQTRTNFLREDIHYNAHLLELLCRYHLEQFVLLDYRLTALQRLINKGRDVSRLHRIGLSILRRILGRPAAERNAILQQFLPDLLSLQHDPIERKSLKYLDLATWVESLLKNRTLAECKPAF